METLREKGLYLVFFTTSLLVQSVLLCVNTGPICPLPELHFAPLLFWAVQFLDRKMHFIQVVGLFYKGT